MIKLIALDLDGTLCDSERNISKENCEAIRKAKAMGVRIVITSGRPTNGVTPILDRLGLVEDSDYAIVFNGAKIYNTKTRETIFTSTISGAEVKELYHEAKRLHIDFHGFYADERLLAARANPYTDVEARVSKIPSYLFDYESLADNENFLKVMFVGDEQAINALTPHIDKRFTERHSMLRSASIFLEFLNKNANKGLALARLRDHLGIGKDETMAIGDAGNDIPMLREAHIGVAMGNAFPETKAAADYVTDDNDHSGVARAIEKFVLHP